MTINKLIEKAHAQAKSMGWWDEPRNTGELLMLIVSECGEALEAHRNGKRADMESWTKGFYDEHLANNDAVAAHGFKLCIKDTFEDELADIVIRIADWMGHNKWGYVQYSADVWTDHSLNVGEMLWGAVTILVGGDCSAASDKRYCSQAIDHVLQIAKDHNIDLWRHIELKLAYNLTRGRKHGKAY